MKKLHIILGFCLGMPPAYAVKPLPSSDLSTELQLYLRPNTSLPLSVLPLEILLKMHRPSEKNALEGIVLPRCPSPQDRIDLRNLSLKRAAGAFLISTLCLISFYLPWTGKGFWGDPRVTGPWRFLMGIGSAFIGLVNLENALYLTWCLRSRRQ